MDKIESDFESRGVRVLAVNVFEEIDAAKRFADASEYEFQWAHGDDEVTSRLGVGSVPALIVLDGDGKVAWRSSLWTTIRRGGDLRNALDELTGG